MAGTITATGANQHQWRFAQPSLGASENAPVAVERTATVTYQCRCVITATGSAQWRWRDPRDFRTVPMHPAIYPPRLHGALACKPHFTPGRLIKGTYGTSISSLDRAIHRRPARIYMGKKPGGGGWLATVRKVFKTSPSCPTNKNYSNKGTGGGEEEQEAAEIVSDEHFPPADTSPDATTNEVVVTRRREFHHGGVEAEARRARRAMASRVARIAALRGREERAAVRIQAFYRGYLALVRAQARVRRTQTHRLLFLDDHVVRRPPRNSINDNNASPFHRGWDAVIRSGATTEPAYTAFGYQDKPNGAAGWHWPLEPCTPPSIGPPAQGGVSVEIDPSRRPKISPPKDLYPVVRAEVPSYMAATQSARAKARMASPAPRAHVRSRSGSVALGAAGPGGSTASSGWSTSNNGAPQ
ncbi:hypothetical protein BRADI_5g13650v3 [Brachypodium distachyon]|uniref:DUF4005 domain-containing protein n=1 Tax=Brachypodium distachyon TaxID=15368 RepID=A0A2K2CH06_BRADI|nr:hypothetical protein BRADI_5g13650v3 [Brachypodium distachyon]